MAPTAIRPLYVAYSDFAMGDAPLYRAVSFDAAEIAHYGRVHEVQVRGTNALPIAQVANIQTAAVQADQFQRAATSLGHPVSVVVELLGDRVETLSLEEGRVELFAFLATEAPSTAAALNDAMISAGRIQLAAAQHPFYKFHRFAELRSRLAAGIMTAGH